MPVVYRHIPIGDVDLEDGPDGLCRPVFVVGADYVKQKLSALFKFFLGEWFLDTRQGVPYFRDVYTQNPDLSVVRSVFRTILLAQQEVARIDSLTLLVDNKTRALSVSFDIALVAGGTLSVVQPDPLFIFDTLRAA